MEEKELKVIKKSKELIKHTVRVTSNINNYPKKYRHSVVDRMQLKSMDIYETLEEANRTDIRLYKRERSELQTNAITYCDELIFYIEMSHDLKFIDMDSMEYWSKLVKDIKHMAIAWRSKDRGR